MPPLPPQHASRRVLRILVAALAAAVVLAGCGDAPKAAPAQKADYVALGDSYTAAPNIGTTTGTDGCYGSYENYPHLVAAKLDFDLEDRSCLGASTSSVTGKQETVTGQTRPPQLDAVTASTDVVTLGIGANDFGMFELIASVCPRYAIALPKEARDTAPCTLKHDAQPPRRRLDARLPKLGDRLRRVLKQIHERSPDARVLVIGYPTIVPGKRSCEALVTTSGDVPLLNEFVDGLNKQLSKAAKAAGATYVDVHKTTRDHHICSKDPWIAGYSKDLVGAIPWHPYAAEQQAVARLITAALEKSAG